MAKHTQNKLLSEIRESDRQRRHQYALMQQQENINEMAKLLMYKIQEWFEHDKIIAEKLWRYLYPYICFKPFYYSNEKVYFFRTNKSFTKYKDFFNFITDFYNMCSSDNLKIDFKEYGKLYEALFNCYIDYLKVLPSESFEPFNLKNNIHPDFKNPSHFVCIDGNIFYKHLSSLFVRCNAIQNISPLDSNTLHKLCCNRMPSSAFLTNLKKKLPPENNFNLREQKRPLLSFLFYWINSIYTIYFDTKKQRFEFNPSPIDYTLCENTFFTQKSFEYLHAPLSENVLQILSVISSASIKTLEKIAFIFSILTTRNYASVKPYLRKLFIIHSEPTALRVFRQLLSACGLKSILREELRLLTKKETFQDIFLSPFRDISYISVFPSKCHEETERQQDNINYLISGKNIKFKNDIGLSTTLKNQLPIICFTESQTKLSYLSETYPSDIIALNFDTEKALLLLSELTEADFHSLAVFLSLYGLLIQTPKGTYRKNPEENQNKDIATSIVNEFLSAFCCDSDGTHIYFSELYDFYKKYYAHKYGSTPLTSIGFNKIVKMKYSFKKQRSNATDNKYAYQNVLFKEDLFYDFLNTPIVNTASDDFDTIILKKQLQLSSMCQNTLNTLPANSLLGTETIKFRLE